MSCRSSSTNSIQKKVLTKKFCKHCFNLGKDEREYTSHYTKESTLPNAKVVCPEILGATCTYCFQNGHLPSGCTELKKKLKFEKEASKEKRRGEHTSNEQKKEANNTTASKKSKSQSRF